MPDVTDNIPANLHGGTVTVSTVVVPPGFGTGSGGTPPPASGQTWPRQVQSQ